MWDAMRMRTACFARAPQRCTNYLIKHFLLTFQEVIPLSKTRNQLLARFRGVVGEIQASGAMAGWGTQSKNGSIGIIKESTHTWRDSVKEKP